MTRLYHISISGSLFILLTFRLNSINWANFFFFEFKYYFFWKTKNFYQQANNSGDTRFLPSFVSRSRQISIDSLHRLVLKVEPALWLWQLADGEDKIQMHKNPRKFLSLSLLNWLNNQGLRKTLYLLFGCWAIEAIKLISKSWLLGCCIISQPRAQQ